MNFLSALGDKYRKDGRCVDFVLHVMQLELILPRRTNSLEDVLMFLASYTQESVSDCLLRMNDIIVSVCTFFHNPSTISLFVYIFPCDLHLPNILYVEMAPAYPQMYVYETISFLNSRAWMMQNFRQLVFLLLHCFIPWSVGGKPLEVLMNKQQFVMLVRKLL